MPPGDAAVKLLHFAAHDIQTLAKRSKVISVFGVGQSSPHYPRSQRRVHLLLLHLNLENAQRALPELIRLLTSLGCSPQPLWFNHRTHMAIHYGRKHCFTGMVVVTCGTFYSF
ncbi:hypothetical protein M758_UG153800 [Ceratodon purpureus]|nr:hypothetical protein M758_UG153800 [Ceratodon purpureus]